MFPQFEKQLQALKKNAQSIMKPPIAKQDTSEYYLTEYAKSMVEEELELSKRYRGFMESHCLFLIYTPDDQIGSVKIFYLLDFIV